MIASILILGTVAYILINIVLVAVRNHKAHQFFRIKSPKLPVVPDPGLFDGHLLTITSLDKNWKIIDKLHHKYGPTFGYFMSNQPWISTKDLDLIKLIWVDKGHKHINRTEFGLPFSNFNVGIFQSVDEDWRRARRAVAPGLTNLKVRAEGITSDIEYVLSKFKEGLDLRLSKAQAQTGSRSAIIDSHDMFQRFALAVIFLVAYKQDGQIDFKGDVDEWTRILDVSSRDIMNPIVILSILFPFLRSLCEFFVQFSPVGNVQLQIVDYITQATDLNRLAREIHTKVQRRMSEVTGAKERDFSDLKVSPNFKRKMIDDLIDAFIDKKVKYDQFLGTAQFLMVAGFETTADTITCLVWQLAQNPDIQKKLRQEITEHGLDGDYVNWVVMETVRWHPAVPLGIGRVISEDIEIPSNGIKVPKGSFVMASIHSVHHDPTIWEDPKRFWPERWAKQSEFHPAAFMGFGLGPRNCVGGKLAIHEIKMVLSMLLKSYRIEKCSETTKEYSFSCPGLVYTIPDQPVRVRLVALGDGETPR